MSEIAFKKLILTKQYSGESSTPPPPNSHGARGLIKHYHLRFYPKRGHGICAFLRILCDCGACTPMLDQTWVSGIPSKKQAHYQPLIYCTYWPVLGSFKNCNIIHMSPKSTPFEVFDYIHQVVFDRISDNMASLLQSGKNGFINTANTTTNGYYTINFISEAYTLKNNTTICGQAISTGELVVKAQYIFSMQETTNVYWKQQPLK